MTTSARYAEFGAREARGESPIYERLALAVSVDDEVLALLERLPPAKRQPNLLFGVVRFLGGPVQDPAAFSAYVSEHWPAIEAELRVRATQTNEAGRCALLLPVLAGLRQPLALLEVGASAGLCLYPDRFSYRYGDCAIGAGEPVLSCAATGLEPPDRLPEVVWRAGLDLNPLDVTEPADVAWLDALNSPNWCAACLGTGSRTRPYCLMVRCRIRLVMPSTTCSRWTERHWRGLVRMVRRSPGSARFCAPLPAGRRAE